VGSKTVDSGEVQKPVISVTVDFIIIGPKDKMTRELSVLGLYHIVHTILYYSYGTYKEIINYNYDWILQGSKDILGTPLTIIIVGRNIEARKLPV
jgi:hypothetical protein